MVGVADQKVLILVGRYEASLIQILLRAKGIKAVESIEVGTPSALLKIEEHLINVLRPPPNAVQI